MAYRFRRRLARRPGEIRDRPLIGGDTTATPGPLTLSITALGTVAKARMIRRSGAKPGDIVFVSGTIGDAGGGLGGAERRGRNDFSTAARQP